MLLYDDFDRIQQIESKWMPDSNQKIEVIQHLNVRLPQIPIPESQKRVPKIVHPKRKKQIEYIELNTSREQNLLLLENMTQKFNRFKYSLSTHSGQCLMEDSVFVTKAETNRSYNNMDQLEILNESRRKMIMNVLNNTRRTKFLMEHGDRQQQHFNSIRKEDQFVVESQVMQKQKERKRSEFISRSPLSNAYYAIKALPRISQLKVMRKCSVMLPPESRFQQNYK